jgi:hypothetical protein
MRTTWIHPMRLFVIAPLVVLICGCASSGKLNTRSGRAEVMIPTIDWKQATIAIAVYNFSKGRELDETRPNEIVLYEAVPSESGEQITSKLVYSLIPVGDGILITSRRFVTDDLDENNPNELADQATLDAEQQELQQIAHTILAQNSSDVESSRGR